MTGFVCATVLALCIRRYLGGNTRRTIRENQVSSSDSSLPPEALWIDSYHFEPEEVGAAVTPVDGLQAPPVDLPPEYTRNRPGTREDILL